MNWRCVGFAFSIFGSICLSCSQNTIQSQIDTTGPEVEILAPNDGDTLYTNPLIEVMIQDESEISEVFYYIDDVQISTKVTEPYDEYWYAGYWPSNEYYTLKVMAADSRGNIGVSNEVVVYLDPSVRIIPELFQPADSINLAAVSTITFACNPCPGANSYKVKWLCVNCPCSSDWCGLVYLNSSDQTISTMVRMDIPPVDLEIVWSIQARYDDDYGSDWSEVRHIFIRALP